MAAKLANVQSQASHSCLQAISSLEAVANSTANKILSNLLQKECGKGSLSTTGSSILSCNFLER